MFCILNCKCHCILLDVDHLFMHQMFFFSFSRAHAFGWCVGRARVVCKGNFSVFTMVGGIGGRNIVSGATMTNTITKRMLHYHLKCQHVIKFHVSSNTTKQKNFCAIYVNNVLRIVDWDQLIFLSLCRYYLLCDSNQSCFVLSVYGVHTDVVRLSAEILCHFLLLLSFSKVDIHLSLLDQGWQTSCMFPFYHL